MEAEEGPEDVATADVVTLAAPIIPSAPVNRTAPVSRNVRRAGRVQCSECNKSFAHASYLKAHQAIHLGEPTQHSLVPVDLI